MRSTPLFRAARLRAVAASGLLLTVVALAACGGGGSSAGVASLDGSSSSNDTNGESNEASKEDTEAELQKWVECMREQGIDLPDPTTDSDGNLTLRPPDPPDDASSDSSSSGSPDVERRFIDRDTMEAAQQECGEPPEGAMGGFQRGDSQELQDQALKFAQCMRDNGVDVPDPTFEDPGAAGGRPEPGEGGPFGELDPDDPAVQKAMETCRSELGGGPMIRGGGPGGSGADTGPTTDTDRDSASSSDAA